MLYPTDLTHTDSIVHVRDNPSPSSRRPRRQPPPSSYCMFCKIIALTHVEYLLMINYQASFYDPEVSGASVSSSSHCR